MKRSNFLLRSMMFVPGHNEKLLLRAAMTDADAVILDIEDSVMPLANKQKARDRSRKAIQSGIFEDFHVFVRVNDRESGLLIKDLDHLCVQGVDGFVYPKAKMSEDVYFFDKLLETMECEKEFPIGTFKIVPLIETAGGVLNAQEICRVSKRVIALAFGCEDFVADIEGVHDKDGQSLFVPRAMISMAARATGVIPIDTVHVNVHNLQELEENLKVARLMGFEGMLILHPKEILLAHRYFSPSAKEARRAREMLKLSEIAAQDGKGVAVIDGKFIGPPMVIVAKKILERVSLIEKEQKR